MYEVSHAGPRRRSWAWWGVTWWATLLTTLYILGTGFVILIGVFYRLPSPNDWRTVLISGLIGGLLLWVVRRRAQQIAAADAAHPVQHVPLGDGAFWVVLVGATAWASSILLG